MPRGRHDGIQQPKGPGCGVAIEGTRRQIVVRCDAIMFNEIHERATLEHTSLAEQIRLLLEWGLEADR